MKKSLSLVLALLMIVILMISCGDTQTTESSVAEVSKEASQEASQAVVEESSEEESLEESSEVITDDVPDTLDFDGDTVTVMVFPGEMTELEFYANEEETEATALTTAIIDRNNRIKDRINVNIEIIKGSTDGQAFTSTVMNHISAGDVPADIIASYSYYGTPLGTNEYSLDLYTLPYLDLSKPWWNQDFVSEMTVNNKLYFVVGDVSLTSVDYAVATFFNKKLVKEYIGVDLYEVVDSGKWTLDYLCEICKDIYEDNGDDKRNVKDSYGLDMPMSAIPLDSLFFAAGNTITKNTGDGGKVFELYTERAISYFDKIYDMLHNYEGIYFDEVSGCTDVMYEKFRNQQTVFAMQRLDEARYLREYEFEYGILPLPKYDEEQEEYMTTAHDAYSLLSVPSTLPESEWERVGATLELLSAESYQTVSSAYFDVILKGQYMNTEDDERMFDLIISGIKFNFGAVYSAKLSDIMHNMVRWVSGANKGTFTSKWDANKNVYNDKLEALLEMYGYSN